MMSVFDFVDRDTRINAVEIQQRVLREARLSEHFLFHRTNIAYGETNLAIKDQENRIVAT
jgi:hypothetical protein